MLQTNSFNKMKVTALLTGGVLMASALAVTAPAQANSSKEKLYKGSAVALGVLGAYEILKGNTGVGALAAGAGYYAYEKGAQENDRDDYYGRWDNNRRWDNDRDDYHDYNRNYSYNSRDYNRRDRNYRLR